MMTRLYTPRSSHEPILTENIIAQFSKFVEAEKYQ